VQSNQNCPLCDCDRLNKGSIALCKFGKRCNLNIYFILFLVAAKQSRTFSPSFNRNKEKALDTSQTLPSVKLIDGKIC